MTVGQLINILAKLNPSLEVGMIQWKAPNFTTWELIPLDLSMIDQENNKTEDPSKATRVGIHRA
jgi:hypothetical protein